MEIKNELLTNIRAAMVPLKEINDLYYTAMNLSQQAEIADTQTISGHAARVKIISIIAGIGAGLLYLLLFAGIISPYISFFSQFPGFLIGLALTYFIGRGAYKLVRSKLLSNVERLKRASAKIAPSLQNISEQIEQVAEENAETISVMPRDYRYYEAAVFFENALANGRADDMKEVINLFEDHLHKMRMENYNQQMLFANEQQTKMLAAIEERAESIDRTTSSMLAFDVFEFISRV